MGPFVWDSKYKLDIEELDREHQHLFALCNELYEAMQEGHGPDVVGYVLGSVAEYTGYHFEHEERLFREYGYDDAAHRAEHARLTDQTWALVRKLQDGQAHVSIATLQFLFDWLKDHVLGSDRRYAPYLIAKGLH